MWGYTCNRSFSEYIIIVEAKLIKINTCIGSRWNRIENAWGHNELLATHYDKCGNSVNLLVTNNFRQLYTSNSKIFDNIDGGVKRTYVYKKIANETHGQMFTPKSIPQEVEPLIVRAHWVTKDLIPKFVELIVNPKHKDAIVPLIDRTENLNMKTEHNITRVKAENFDEILGRLVPRRIIMETKDNQKFVSENTSDNFHYAKIFNISQGHPGIDNLRVLV